MCSPIYNRTSARLPVTRISSFNFQIEHPDLTMSLLKIVSIVSGSVQNVPRRFQQLLVGQSISSPFTELLSLESTWKWPEEWHAMPNQDLLRTKNALSVEVFLENLVERLSNMLGATWRRSL